MPDSTSHPLNSICIAEGLGLHLTHVCCTRWDAAAVVLLDVQAVWPCACRVQW